MRTTALRRALVDGLASVGECRHAVGAAALGMDGLGEPEGDSFNGETTLVASPPEGLRACLGEGGVRLVRLLLRRIEACVRETLDEHPRFKPMDIFDIPLEPFPRSTRERHVIKNGIPVHILYYERDGQDD